MTTLADLELRRARWRRARAACHLLDAEDPEFAQGGLARRLDRVSVRLLVLPCDPERSRTPVDEDLLEHLHAVAKEWGRAHGVEDLWGFGKVATAGGACLYDYDNSSSGPWNQYLCVRSDGGLDVGLGAQVFREWDDVKCFFLSATVARLWFALAAHGAFCAKEDGPCEVALALVETEGSVLGGCADGWPQPLTGFRDEARRCPDPNILLRIELSESPVAEDAQELAFALGALIENAWGYAIRRFIARTGPFEGKFDWRAATR